jgi:PAS domain S-box-containing protein
MTAPTSKLKKRYILFILSVVIVIFTKQAVIQYDLNRQTLNSQLINDAGRQRMLSQLISKIALYIFVEAKDQKKVSQQLTDSLIEFTNQFESNHKNLIKRNEEKEENPLIRKYLTQNTIHLNSIIKSARSIAKKTSSDITQELTNLKKAEQKFLPQMEKIVAAYQWEAEHQLNNLRLIEISLATFAALILLSEFVYVFVPTINQLNVNSRKLIKLNTLLAQQNNDLSESEKEARDNLQEISQLRESLQYREKQYRELVEGALDIIFELNESGQFVFVNEVMEGISGYAKSEILGKTYDVLVHPNDFKHVQDFYRKQLRSKETSSYLEFQMVKKDGSIVWIGQNTRFTFAGSWVTKVSVIARDITLLKNTQDQLAESEQYYRLLSENSTDVISLTNSQRFFTFVSQSSLEVMGYSSEELIGKPIWEFIHTDDLLKIKQGGESVRNGSGHVAIEFRILHKKGYYIWVESHSKQFYKENSNELFVQSSFRDITQRKNAEDKLAQSERLYRLLSENSRDVISLHSIDGVFEYISPSCINLHGYLPEELIGKNGSEFIHPEDALIIEKEAPKILDLMQQGAEIEPMQFRIMSKHRGEVWAENMIKPIFQKGVLTGFQSTVRDISSRKQFEVALQQAKDVAVNATKAKSQFLSMMSHEIRTPMNAVIGLTNLLIDKESRKDQLEKLQLLKFSGENLLTIINDILDFSKIEANKVQLEFINFNLVELLEKTIKIYQPRAAEQKIKLIHNFPQDIPRFIIGDPVRLGQIITNLVGNAIKFTEKGKVELRLTKELDDDETIRFCIEVIDTGIGIPEDKLSTIFESFSQAELTTTRKYGGSGLGLSITRYLIKAMGGEIKVKSRLGLGSTFYFSLTCNKGQQLQESESKSHDYVQLLQNKNIHVLLVDDNTVNQLVVMEFLHDWNISTSTAYSGKEAIELITRKNYDLVLMDLQMPEMSGYEATRIIRSMSDQYYKQVPIVALTASAIGDIRARILEAGMNDFLIKPFQPNELQEIIVKHGFTINFSNQVASSTTISTSLQSITKGNKEFEQRLLSSALENINELKDEFNRALRTNDSEVYRAIVHKCKMSLNFLKNHSVLQMIREMNILVNEGGPEKIPDELRTRFIATLEVAIADVISLLK